MNKIRALFQKHASRIFIILLFPTYTIINFSHHSWVNPEKVMEWDVKSYYAYLPAAFIHKDLSLDFIKENPKEYNKWFWPVQTEIGKKCIVTSMGLSILYSPFFFIAHAVAHVSGFDTLGYSEPYALALVFSAMFYVILGAWFLRKLLLKYFDETTTVLTLFVVLFGTNLLHYTSWAAAMSHSYNFGLISVYIYLVDKWYDRINLKRTLKLGFLSGLIVLIRPTNILVLIILFFWNTKNFKDIGNRVKFFISNYKHVLIMIAAFFLVWIPQFLYWKYVSGKFLYFSYAGIGGTFFWDNPQFKEILFSFRKGWWIYTPIMLISSLGILLLFKKMKIAALAILIFLIANIYLQASWWSWWFGGAFGLRAFIDSYGILAIPLAAIISFSIKLRWKGVPVLVLIGLLTWYNMFQTKQYHRMAIHWWWMSKTSYKISFLKEYAPKGYWEAIPIPDYKKAREGIYVASNLITRSKGYKSIHIEPEEIVASIKSGIEVKEKHLKMARKYSVSPDSILTIEAYNIYEKKWSIDKYVRPLITKKLADSLSRDTTYLQSNIENWRILEKSELASILMLKSEDELKTVKFE